MNLFKQLVESSPRIQLKNWQTNNLARVYLLSITHLRGKEKVLHDRFIKIGYSKSLDLDSRIQWMPTCYEVTVLDSIIMDSQQAFQTEQALHKALREWHYKPKHSRWSGANEAYRLELMTEFKSLDDMILRLPSIVNQQQVEARSYSSL